MTKEELSAGGVVYFEDKGVVRFLLGKHSGYHKWVLPKGMVEKGESLVETAVREVAEEVGVEAKVVEMAPLKTIEYFYMADLAQIKGVDAKGQETVRRVVRYQENGGGKVRVHKRVVFYLMEKVRDFGKAGWEMEERKWVSFGEGMKMLAFESEREVLRVAGKVLGMNGASDQN